MSKSFTSKQLSQLLRFLIHNWVVIGFFSFWFVYFAVFWSRAISFDPNGNLMIGHINLWGDWAVHFTMGSSMAYRQLILDTSPLLLGAPFGYPFFANWLSAMLIRLSVPFFIAFTMPSLIFSLILVITLFWFYLRLFKSKHIAVIASIIFLLNGGFGFLRYFDQVAEAPNKTEAIFYPKEKYTHNDSQNIRWISIIDSMILPQRAFNHGFPLALLAIGWLYLFLEKLQDNRTAKSYVWAGGLVLGVLPILHTHSFIAAAIILPCWFLFSVLFVKKAKKFFQIAWLPIVIALLLAVPLLFWLGGNADSFIRLNWGWYGAEDSSWIGFWLKNWGLTPWLALTGWAWLIKKNKGKAKIHAFGIFFPFFLIFVLANIFLFQPHAWDNTKLFAWASVGFSGLAALFLKQLASLDRKPIIGAGIAALLLVTTTLSGLIDAYMIQQISTHNYMLYSREELDLATWVKEHTETSAIWLTGDNHNHWLYNLTGRQTMMAFRPWLWTHGYDYGPMERDISFLFTQPDKARHLISRYNIKYAVVGPNELETWKANLAAFETVFPIIHQSDRYTIFDLQPENYAI
ncbi:hypothetical protein KBC79_06265 [Candidatus Woesebacteria bacterium]|nr:hypothetical protein [Candidatus Woesebacteria bacterium]